jgi:hypothetical protein
MFLACFSFRVFANIEKVNEEIRLIYIFMSPIPDSRLLLIVPDSLLLWGDPACLFLKSLYIFRTKCVKLINYEYSKKTEGEIRCL